MIEAVQQELEGQNFQGRDQIGFFRLAMRLSLWLGQPCFRDFPARNRLFQCGLRQKLSCQPRIRANGIAGGCQKGEGKQAA